MEHLKQQNIWACWRDDKKPRNPLTGNLASSIDASTWSSYDDCVSAVNDGEYDGIGMMCNGDMVFIDIDHCLWETPNGTYLYEDTPNGYIPAEDIVKRFTGTYMEVSKSNTGIHIICYGNVDIGKTGVRSRGVELYKAGRFLIITENILDTNDTVVSKQQALDWLCEMLYDAEKPQKQNNEQTPYGKCQDAETSLKKAMTDETFRDYYCGVRPYEDESRNDHGFITKLCFYFNRDPEVSYEVLMKSPYFMTKDNAHKEKMERRFDSYFLPTFDQVNSTLPTVWGENVNILTKDHPRWLVETKKGLVVDEVAFVEDFMRDLHYINGEFYDDEANVINTGYIESQIQETIGKYFTNNLASRSAALLGAIRNAYYEETPPLVSNIIHCKNTDVIINSDGISTMEGGFNLRRLPINYDPNATCPRWEQFISELFYADDAKIVQEYLGYCLVPTTKAQTALFILGNGGEGKSRITAVMSQLLGNKAVPINVAEMQNDRFFAAQAENALCLIDDDASIDHIEKTETFKKLVTADAPFSIEQKYQKKRTAYIYARLLVCSNAVFNSKFDRSDGFYRRLIQIRVKSLEEQHRTSTDRNLSEKLTAELSGILNWCIKGLLRLQANDYTFTQSTRVDDIAQQSKIEANSTIAFVADESFVTFSEGSMVSSKDLYRAYCEWCEETCYNAVKKKTMMDWLSTHSDELHIEYSNNVLRNGKRCRGFVGMKLTRDEEYQPIVELA